jgi:hypothetical protein
MRKNLKTKILQNGLVRLAHFSTDAGCEIHQVDVLSGEAKGVMTCRTNGTTTKPDLNRRGLPIPFCS